MFCDPSVVILAIILESIPWCYLVVDILFLGSWTRDSLYLLHVDSVARSFRLLVTFAIVLEVRGISFFQYHEPSWQKFFSTKRSQPGCSWGVLHPYCESASPTSLHGLSGRNLLNLVRHTNLCIHNSESYMFLWVVPLHLYSDLHLSIDSEECVSIRSSVPIILVVR